MRKLTPEQAAKEDNIYFSCEGVSIETLIVFDELMVAAGRREKLSTELDVLTFIEMQAGDSYYLEERYSSSDFTTEQVELIPSEPLSLEVDSLTEGTTLVFQLPSNSQEHTFQTFLSTLQSLKNEELLQSFVTEDCLRKLSDTDLLSLARFAITKANKLEHEATLSSFLATATTYRKKRTEKVTFFYRSFKKMTIQAILSCQLGLYQEELKASGEWDGLVWERLGG